MKTAGHFGKKVLSMFLAVVMAMTMFVTAAPETVDAAGKSLKGTGTSAVTISDKECYSGNSYKIHYIKYKAGKTGYVTLKFKNASKKYNESFGYVTLCNDKKKAIGQKKEIWRNDKKESVYYTRSYGVKKGKTYYFAVECDGGTKITATTTEVKKSTANSKAKAKSLKKDKKVTGVLIAGESQEDWYKLKTTGTKKVKLSYTVKTNGSDFREKSGYGIKITFYDKNGKKWTKNSYTLLTGGAPKNAIKISMGQKDATGALIGEFGIPDGTYWVKVEPMRKGSSGQYTIQWTTY